jgi:hypothetical protein
MAALREFGSFWVCIGAYWHEPVFDIEQEWALGWLRLDSFLMVERFCSHKRLVNQAIELLL